MKKLISILSFLIILAVSGVAWGGWLYWDQQGAASYMGALGVKGVTGIGYNNKVVASGSQDRDLFVYDGGWSKTWVSGATAGPKMMFIDSNDYLYISYDNDDNLYRSTDGGANFTSVLTPSGVSVEVMSMAEDNSGNLYAIFYDTYELYYSSDQGASWTAVTLPTNYLTVYTNHLHYVYWCQHRNVLMITGGDNSDPAATIFYTSLKAGNITAEGWTAVPNTIQAIGITSDADYVYFSTDTAEEVGQIYRITWPSSGSPSTVESVYTGNAGNWAWWGHVNDLGYVIFCLSNGAANAAQLVASYDQGENWAVLKTFTATHGPSYFALPSSYNTSWDGFYWSGSTDATTDSYFSQWQVFEDNKDFYVSESGTNWASTYTQSDPGGVGDLWGLFKIIGSNGRVVLAADYSNGIVISGVTNAKFSGGNYSIGSYTDSPEFYSALSADDFSSKYENNGTVAVGGGVATFTATADATVYAQGKKENVLAAGSGSMVWLQGKYNPAQGFAGNIQIASLYGTGFAVGLWYDSDEQFFIKTESIEADSRIIYQYRASNLDIASSNTIQLGIYIHNTNGFIVLYCDNIPQIVAGGIDTYDGANYVSGWWGISGGAAITNDYATWDDIVLTDEMVNQPFSLYINGAGINISNLKTTGRIHFESSGMANNILFNGSSEGIEMKTAAGKLFNSTFNGCTTGIDNNAATTIQNCIFYNNTTDIDTTGGAVTGGYNLFDGENPSANYTDAGSNDIENSDPLFVSATDFRLKPGSPCIKAGVDVDCASCTDLNGNVVTAADGSALPRFGVVNIGAYWKKQMGNLLW